MDEKNYTIYKHTTPDGKIYIGATGRPVQERWNNGNGYRANMAFWESILHWGWDNITHEILAEGLTKSEAASRESEFIRIYNADRPEHGFNKSSGNGFIGCSHTEETRQKMSEHRKGKTAARTFVVQEKAPGQWHYYSSVKKAAARTGIDASNISKAARGQRRTAGGFRWRYYMSYYIASYAER